MEDDLPWDLRHHGVLLRKTGQYQPLVRHMLASKCVRGLTDERLRSIVHVLKVKVVKLGEKTVTKRSLLWSLILALFDDLNQEEKMEILLELSGQTVKPEFVPDDIVDGALKSLPHDEVKMDFEGLRERLDKKLVQERFKQEVKRNVDSRAEAEHWTPECIKQLRPKWKGAAIVLDNGNKSFQAYYPGGQPTKSVGMSWERARGSSDEGRTKLAALTYCVEYLWRNHEAKGRTSAALALRRNKLSF